MRTTVAAAVACSILMSLAQAQSSEAAIRKPVNIPAQELSAALQGFAQDRDLFLIYDFRDVRELRTAGASGEMTAGEALASLLSGTGLTYRYLDENTVTIVPLATQPAKKAVATTANAAKLAPMRLAQAESADVASVPATRAELNSGEKLEEITVRGTPWTDANVDIVRTEDDPQPYYIYSGEEIAKSNTVDIGEFFKQRLTMNHVKTSESQTTFGGVNSTIDLRGFGSDQTLVLINGRRANGSNDSQFDLNAIAPSLIERIEILPGSASAIYGGNAIGGVVNVILKRDFTGGDLSLTYDTPMDVNAPLVTVSGSYGWLLGGGRTNVTLSANYRDSGDALLVGDRPELVQRGLTRVLERDPSRIYTPDFPAAFGTTPNIASADGSELVFKDGTPLGGSSLGSSLTYIPSGISSASSIADLQQGLLQNAGGQNTTMADIGAGGSIPGARMSLLTPSEAYSVAGAIRHKATDRLELTAEATYNSTEGHSVGNRNGFISAIALVPGSSPANPFAQDVWVAYPVDSDFGKRSYRQESMRAVLGFVFDLPHDWRVQGDYVWNRSEQLIDRDLFDLVSGEMAAAAAFADGTLNPFVDSLAFPLNLLPYTTSADRYTQDEAWTVTDTGLRVSGPVGSLPAGPINLTFGLGYREEKLEKSVNEWGPVWGRASTPPNTQRVESAYFEGWVPLIASFNDIPGVQALDLQVAHRQERYSVNADLSSYTLTFPPDHDEDFGESFERTHTGYTARNSTVGLRYKPMDSLTVRASLGMAFLPPGFGDLQQLPPDPTVYDYWGPDPQRGNEMIRARGLYGGNSNLEPLESDSVHLGFVFEPTVEALAGLRLGLEWFRIDRQNLIWYPELNFLLANEARYPDRIVRAAPEPGDPYGVGPITLIDQRLLNANEVSIKGFDLSLGYRRATASRGAFSFDLLATIVDSYTVSIGPLDPAVEAAGKVNELDAPLKLKGNATLGWQRGPWSLSWTAVYYGRYEQAPWFHLAQGGTTIPHQIYHDFGASYRFAEQDAPGARGLLSGVTMTLGVNNVFDTLPPFDADIPGSSSPATAIGTYYSTFGDPRLRSIRLAIGKRF